MPKGVSRSKQLANKAREAALEAVAAYNNPLATFKSDTYVVLMHVAWMTLLHAIFVRRAVKPYYRLHNGRFERIEGRPKTWDLAEYVRRYWPGQTNPVTENLRFFVGLRHLIEHAHAPEIDIDIFGECQAMLINFEDLISQEFGAKLALNTSLAFSLQFSRMRQPESEQAMRDLLRKVAATDIKKYIDAFRSSLGNDIAGDMAYSYKVFLLPVPSNHRTRETLPVQFVHHDPGTAEEYEKAVTMIKQRLVPVANLGKFKVGGVVSKVAPRIAPKVFNPDTHTRAWKYYDVRPPTGSQDPATCNAQYCQYDVAHGDYLYTDEWVNFLVEQLSDEAVYAAVRAHGTRAAVPAPTA
jgi:hypothetical protein